MMLSVPALIARYSLFAIVATAFNLAAQEVSLALYDGPENLMVCLLIGTAVGFGVKYFLDKRFIFFDRRKAAAHELIKLLLYGFTAIGTTVFFWSLELAAWSIWATSLAKYIGAIVGLIIGYVTKYLLDRRFVFIRTGVA